MPRPAERPGAARTTRWRGAAEVLAHVRRATAATPDGEHRDGVTRAETARALGLSSSSSTEIAARLRRARLLTEEPAPPVRRGRPTTVLRAHPEGPLVLAMELGQEGWRSALADVTGQLADVREHRHARRDPEHVLGTLAAAVREAHCRAPGRVRAVSLAVAGTVQDGNVVQASTLGWHRVDLSRLTAAAAGAPLLVGNDATLAGVAEARGGAATGASTALHLLVEVGLGGMLVVDGLPVTGAFGTGGEYGHLPFGTPGRRCPCGADGCWDLEVDGRALARRLGEPTPADPRSYAGAVVGRAGAGDPDAARAVAAVTAALARGTAGLVNALDPDVVTLGGLAVPLRAAAADVFASTYRDGLMTFRRAAPPPVLDALYGDDGPLHGAAAVGLDHVTGESALADWADRWLAEA